MRGGVEWENGVGVTSSQDVTGRYLPLVTAPALTAWRTLAPHHRATPARTYYGSPVKLEKYGNAGSCGQLWEELEMVWQRKVGAGI